MTMARWGRPTSLRCWRCGVELIGSASRGQLTRPKASPASVDVYFRLHRVQVIRVGTGRFAQFKSTLLVVDFDRLNASIGREKSDRFAYNQGLLEALPGLVFLTPNSPPDRPTEGT
jgi:hypothetical protein